MAKIYKKNRFTLSRLLILKINSVFYFLMRHYKKKKKQLNKIIYTCVRTIRRELQNRLLSSYLH